MVIYWTRAPGKRMNWEYSPSWDFSASRNGEDFSGYSNMDLVFWGKLGGFRMHSSTLGFWKDNDSGLGSNHTIRLALTPIVDQDLNSVWLQNPCLWSSRWGDPIVQLCLKQKTYKSHHSIGTWSSCAWSLSTPVISPHPKTPPSKGLSSPGNRGQFIRVGEGDGSVHTLASWQQPACCFSSVPAPFISVYCLGRYLKGPHFFFL